MTIGNFIFYQRKQDGHNTSQQNTPTKEQPYMYEKMNNQQPNSRGGNNR